MSGWMIHAALAVGAAAALLAGTPARADTSSRLPGGPRRLSAAERFNYVVGTQTFGPSYRFTQDDGLTETARAILAMGSNTLKCTLSGGYLGLPKVDEKWTPVERIERVPAVRRVLDMPFAHCLLWVYTTVGTSWTDGLSADEASAEYRQMYDLARWLLRRYDRTGRSFYLGHWEGDWHLLGAYDLGKDPSPAALQGMADWLRTRTRAVDDARRDTPHHDVQVWTYAEVNAVQKAMSGGHALTNDVLPKTSVDYVSYSSYDSLGGDGAELRRTLQKALSYIESKLPSRPGVPGRRVFIGEYGAPTVQFTPQRQAERSREVIRAALEWGCPFVLYWEMYNNEVQDGKQRGFWLIDDSGVKQPVYDLHAGFLRRARAWVAGFLRKNRRPPTADEYRSAALKLLD